MNEPAIRDEVEVFYQNASGDHMPYGVTVTVRVYARDDLAKRVFAMCVVDVSTRCWIWTGAKSPNGYGRVKVDGRLALPHRVMGYCTGKLNSIFDPDDGDYVLHGCDNPACCNPDHHTRGSKSDNMKDCVAKGRHKQPKHRRTEP